jgi:ribonuclease HI
MNLTAHVDGGRNGIGVAIDGPGTTIRISRWLGRRDSNLMEYLALLEALQIAVTLCATKLHVLSDAQVVVKQMTGEYDCRSQRLHSINWTCRKLARSLRFSIEHISRDDNREAHALAAAAKGNA